MTERNIKVDGLFGNPVIAIGAGRHPLTVPPGQTTSRSEGPPLDPRPKTTAIIMAREKTAASVIQRVSVLPPFRIVRRAPIASRCFACRAVNPQPVVPQRRYCEAEPAPLQVTNAASTAPSLSKSPMRDLGQISILKTGPADVAMFSKTPFPLFDNSRGGCR